MGFIHVERQNIAVIEKEKSVSLSQSILAWKTCASVTFCRKNWQDLSLVWMLLPAEGFETFDSHIVFWVTGSQSASCRVLQNYSCSCVQKGGGWFCYDSPNRTEKRLSTFKSSIFILTTKRECLEMIQAISSGTLENSIAYCGKQTRGLTPHLVIISMLVLFWDSFICELVALHVVDTTVDWLASTHSGALS